MLLNQVSRFFNIIKNFFCYAQKSKRLPIILENARITHGSEVKKGDGDEIKSIIKKL